MRKFILSSSFLNQEADSIRSVSKQDTTRIKSQDSEFLEFADFFDSKINDSKQNQEAVVKIIEEVKSDQDLALIRLCNKFDKTSFSKAEELLVSNEELENCDLLLSLEVKNALKKAFERVYFYHQQQMPSDFEFVDQIQTRLGNVWRAIESIGVYVPGGSASYPSSVIMSVVPALVAGVKNISICAPSSSGKLNPATLYAAKLCGVTKIYKIGGAQAIAAMAYGTKIVRKVNKIVGPGNSYVAYAKKLLFGEVGIDMIAGPTDLTIIADGELSNPIWIACDALSQLEHGHDSKVFVITNNKDFATELERQINQIAKTLPRYEIIVKSLQNSAILLLENLDDSVLLVDFIAPEHLQIITKNSFDLAKKIRNCGAIFLGEYTPEAIGDYIAGPSHTLPTSSTAKFASGLSVYDFLKRISLISCNKASFDILGPEASVLAQCEGLNAHKLSIDVRLNPRDPLSL